MQTKAGLPAFGAAVGDLGCPLITSRRQACGWQARMNAKKTEALLTTDFSDYTD